MEYNKFLQTCRGDEVLAFQQGTYMFKMWKFKQAVEKACGSQLPESLIASLEAEGIQGVRINGKYGYDNQKWFSEGKDCEILKIGAKGWQKGKVRLRVSLEFCPDEPDVAETPTSNQPEISQPESPLDDIRRMINQETQQNNQ